jgi:hypothetical protein
MLVGLVLITGLAVGAVTSIGQGHLSTTLSPLVNSASAWLVAPFVVGSLVRSDRGAGVAGLTVCLLQLVGYSITAELRGFSAGGSIVVFWSACAIVGGPLFGTAGRLWRTRTDALRGLGAAVLPAAFVAEGLWVYVHELQHYGAAALWVAIGALLSLLLVDSTREQRWLAITIPVALAAEALVTQIYSQSF